MRTRHLTIVVFVLSAVGVMPALVAQVGDEKPGWAKDLHVMTNFVYERGTWTFHFTVSNRSEAVAYRNIKYDIGWFGSGDAVPKAISDVVAPGNCVQFSESQRGPSPFGKTGGIGGLILASREKDMVTGVAVDEDQLHESIRTTMRIVGAETATDYVPSKSTQTVVPGQEKPCASVTPASRVR